MIQFKPNWAEKMTAAEAEKTLQGFKFVGPGWYQCNGKMMLVIPCDRPNEHLWYQRHHPNSDGEMLPFPPDEQFEFNVWDVCPADSFNLILNAPYRGPF